MGWKSLRNLIWLTEFAFSVVGPLVLSILLAVWLRDRWGWGDWVMVVGVFLGLGGAVSGFVNSLRTMKRLGGEDEEKKPPSFNDHE